METYMGVVTHYFNHLGVAVLSLTGELKIGDVIHLLGHTTDFFQEVLSLEIDHHQVEAGRPGESVAMKVIGTVRKDDRIFLAPEATPTEPGELEYQWLDG